MLCRVRKYSFSSRRCAIINFIAVQMKIDKNGKIGRKQLRGRSDFFLLKQTGSERGRFLWETADCFPRRLVNEILGARSCNALAPILRLRLLRRNSTAGFAPRDREEKRIWRSGSQKRTEQTLKNTQRDAKNKSRHSRVHICFALRGRIILADRSSRKKLTTRLRSSNMRRPRHLTHYIRHIDGFTLVIFLIFVDSVNLQLDEN